MATQKVIKDSFVSQNTGVEAILEKNEFGNVTGVKPITRRLRHRQHAFIIALEKTFGNVSQAATLTGILRDRHYDWLKKYEDYRQKVDTMTELSIDFVESKLFQRINEGSTSDIQFYLRTKGKARGYDDSGMLKLIKPVTINEIEITDEQLPDSK